jgi:hypothetical protein
MQMLILINHENYEQILDFSKKISRDKSDSYLFIINSPPKYIQSIVEKISLSNLNILKIVDFFSLEYGFLNNKVESNEFLTDRDYNEIMISDRFLSKSLVSGVCYLNCVLSRECEISDVKIVNYINNLTNYLKKLITDYNITHCYLYCIAGATALCISKISKKLNIPVYILGHSRIDDFQRIEQSYDGLVNTYNASRDTIASSEATLFANQFIAETKNFSSTPEYMRLNYKKLLKSVTLKSYLKEFLKIIYSFRPYDNRYLRRRLKGDLTEIKILLKRRKLLKSGMWNNVPSEKFYFYPLHVDPEASTLVLTPYLTNQLFLIEQIAKQLPFNTKLVVKDHFPMIGKRPSSFYKSIEKFPNVRIVDPLLNSKEILSKSLGVFTITGSVVLEASILGKPSFVFGVTPFSSFKNKVFYISDVTKINDAFIESQDRFDLDLSSIIIYLENVYESSVKIPAKYLWGKCEESEIDEFNNLLSHSFLKQVE